MGLQQSAAFRLQFLLVPSSPEKPAEGAHLSKTRLRLDAIGIAAHTLSALGRKLFPTPGLPEFGLEAQQNLPLQRPPDAGRFERGFPPRAAEHFRHPFDAQKRPLQFPTPVYPEVVHMTSPGESDAQTLANFCMNLSPLDNQLEGHS